MTTRVAIITGAGSGIGLGTAQKLAGMGYAIVNDDVTPYPRLGTVEDIASTIAFLCSPGGEFINGQTIVVDGGWSSTKSMSEYALTSEWSLKRARSSDD